MKNYIKPNTDITKVNFEGHLLAGTAVQTGGSPKDEYTPTDPSFGKNNSLNSSSLWASDDEEE